MASTLSSPSSVDSAPRRPTDRRTDPAASESTVWWRRSPERSLRTVLGVNAATSALFGVAGLVAADRLTDWMGLGDPTVMRAVSAALLAFAAAVAYTSTRHVDGLRSGALLVSVVDLTWVAATVAVVLAADLSAFGLTVAVVVGAGVADFALGQLWFRHLLKR